MLMNRETIGSIWAENTTLRLTDDESREGFARRAAPILERHRSQNEADIKALQKRYAKPIFGKVRIWDLILQLGSCVDPTDQRLFCASQQVHVLQMLDAMEHDGTASAEMVLVALVHDLGKVLLLSGEDPANVVCMNRPAGEDPEGCGLDAALMQWNHDEFAYIRLRDHLPEESAWLVRYHSVEVGAVANLMSEQDLDRTRRLLLPFSAYDHATKSPFNLPGKTITRYRDIVEEAFPRRIKF